MFALPRSCRRAEDHRAGQPFGALVVLATLLALMAPALAGDPDRVWKTVETEHFVIHYYEPLGDVARRVGVVAERSHAVLAPALRHSPSERTQVIVVDDTDGANGFAGVLPRNRITLFATAPISFSALNDHDDWLYGLTAHEYTHILHLDSIAGLASLYNSIFGKTWAPNQVQPRWVIEGIATYEESKRSSSGRTRSAQFHMNLRVPALKGELLELDAVSHGPRAWPHGTAAYLYGSHFLKYVFDRYGDDKLADMSWAYGSDPIPYGLNRSIERITGRTFVDLYEDWRRHLVDTYSLQLEAIERRGRIEGRRLTFSGESNFNPRWARSGEYLVWFQSDGVSRARFRAMPAGGNIADAWDYAIIDRAGAFDLLADGSMVVEQNNLYKSEYSFQDLFLWDRETKRLTQLTHGRRARDPAVSPDETQVAFVVNARSQSRLALMPLRPEAPHRILWEGPGRFDQVSAPAWSPDGRRIAFSAWRTGGYRDILIVEVDSGEVTELMHDRAQDLDPDWDPAGRYLYYSSERTGIYNLYAYDLETGATHQVTNLLGTALQAAVSPDGTRATFTGFDVGGYDLFETELVASRWLEPQLYVNERPDPTLIRDDEYAVSEPRDYRALETLAPNAYQIQIAAGTNAPRATITTSGSDVAGHNAYNLSATVDLEDGNLGIGGGYSYNRLWPSLRIAGIRTRLERGGVVIDGQNTPYVEEHLGLTASIGLPVLREAEASANLNLDYDLDWLRNVEDRFDEHDPNDLVPRFPETDVRLSGMALRFSYSDTRGWIYGLGPQEGHQLFGSIRFNHPAIGSDFRSMALDYRYNTFIRLPWGVTPVLAVRLAGGIRTTERERVGQFVLGGVPEQDVINSVLQNLRAGHTGYLRGFPQRFVAGRQFHLLNLEYRQELWNVEGGAATLPFFVRRLHVAGLLDAGHAFEDEIDPADFNLSVGGSLRLDTVLGYFIPGAIDIGYARGLTEGGVSEFWLLLTGTI